MTCPKCQSELEQDKLVVKCPKCNFVTLLEKEAEEKEPKVPSNW